MKWGQGRTQECQDCRLEGVPSHHHTGISTLCWGPGENGVLAQVQLLGLQGPRTHGSHFLVLKCSEKGHLPWGWECLRRTQKPRASLHYYQQLSLHWPHWLWNRPCCLQENVCSQQQRTPHRWSTGWVKPVPEGSVP
jgi:hypothetical protein